MPRYWPFNKYPGTDYETFNWEWILKTVKEWVATMQTFKNSITAAWEAMQADWQEFITSTYKEQITDILEDHPEWVTTVMDGAITYEKLNDTIKTIVTPEMFGAVGDGIVDDTAAIQAALDGGKNIIFLHDTYKVSVGSDGYALKIPSNKRVNLNNASLILTPNNLNTYQIILIEDDSNITVENGSIIGDAERHSFDDSTSEWGHCLHLAGAENIQINNIECKNAIGDGIYMHASCKNIYIDDVRIKDTGRNGITVAGADPCYINNATVINAYRVSPKTGVDIEPNTNTDTCVVYINNLTSEDNAATIQIGNMTGVVENVQCANIKGDSRFVVNNPNSDAKLNVSVDGMVLSGSDLTLLYLCNQADDSQININDVKLENNYENSRDVMFFSNISNDDNRNIHLSNITVMSDNCYIPVSTSQDRTQPGIQNCEFKGSLLSGWSYNGNAYIQKLKMIRNNKKKMIVSSSDTGSYNYQYNEIENQANTNRYFYYDHTNAPDGYEIAVINNGTGNFLFRTNSGNDFVLNGDIGYQYGLPPGASMIIKYDATINKWIAKDLVGEIYIV